MIFFYKAMNKRHYHTMEISEFQLDQKFISSVPSILQITAPKLCINPSDSCSTHFLLCFSEQFTSCTFLHQNKMNMGKAFKSSKHKNNFSFPLYLSLHPLTAPGACKNHDTFI